MGLSGEYNDLLMTEFLIEVLKDGEIPTVEELYEQFDSLKQEYPLIGDKPLFSIKENKVAFYENASASKFNDTFSRLEDDIHLLYEVMHELQQRITQQSIRWSTHYSNVRGFLDGLEDRIDTLLLMEGETLGYYKYVSDDFSTVDYTDLDMTDAEVDTGLGVVQIGHNYSLAEGYSRIDLSDVTSSNISFYPVIGPGVLSFSSAPGFNIEDIVSDETNTWLGWLLTTGQNTPASVAVQIKLTDSTESVGFNKVSLVCNGSTATSVFILTLYYSDNGSDWLLIPTDFHTQSTMDSISWAFPTVQAKHLRIVMTKNAPDDINSNNQYSWDFGIKTLKLYEDAYETRTGYTWQSTVRSTDDIDLVFTKAALSVCEIDSEETNISYYLSVDSGAAFHPIAPLERESPSKPQVLDFSELHNYTNDGSNSIYDITRTAKQLDLTNQASEALVTGELPLNFFIRQADVSSLTENDIVVYRNVGDKTSTASVRGYTPGFTYDGENGVVRCYFVVSDPDGVDIDFGPDAAKVDETSVSGSVHIAQGTHTFETSTSNVMEVTAGHDSETDLKEEDLLHPHNHLYLLLGYSYGSSYVDEEVYTGVSLVAEAILDYLPRHQFKVDTDSNDPTVYTRDVDSSGNVDFIVKIDPLLGDYEDEEFLVSYPLTNKTFNSVVLKAVLSTTDASVTPMLDSYLIKLG
jgi:hypothetical protein